MAEGDAFEIAGTPVPAGERVRVEVPVARATTGGWMTLPMEVVHGARPGPCLWLSGAIHGDEIDGVDIVRRVLGRLRAGELAGVVIGIPIVNVFGFITESRYLPDRRDLNRSFPGSEKGSLAARLAHLFMTEVVQRSDWGVDFHSGSDDRENLPQVRADLDDRATRAAALAFGAPVTIHGRPPADSLRHAAVEEGSRVVVYEGGEAHRFNEEAIGIGEQGVLRVLRHLGMFEAEPGSAAEAESIESRKTRWVRAGRSGICRLAVRLGDRVRKGAVLGEVTDSFGDRRKVVKSAHAGIVIGRRINPLVYQGEGVVHLADL